MNAISIYGCTIVFDIFKNLIIENKNDFISNEDFTASYLPQIMAPPAIIIMENDDRYNSTSNRYTFLYKDSIHYFDAYYSACTDYKAKLDKFINSIVEPRVPYFNYFN